jgi:hypothetical protein
MPLTGRDKQILDILAQYTFLDYCKNKGLISEERYEQVIFSFGSEAHEIIDYYVCRLDEHYEDTSRFLKKGQKN